MKDYPYLYKLMGAYFNQDYYLIADTLDGIVDDFLRTTSTENINGLRSDIVKFLQENQDDVEAAFEKAYGADFDPKLWDHTADSFLRRVHFLLGRNSA